MLQSLHIVNFAIIEDTIIELLMVRQYLPERREPVNLF